MRRKWRQTTDISRSSSGGLSRLARRRARARDSSLFCTITCMRWVTRRRKLAPLLHGGEIGFASAFRRASGSARMLAAATASCTARLMPTPPIGDIACAASPMQSRPGRCQRREPVDRDRQQLDCSQSPELADAVRECRHELRDALPRNAGRPARLTASMPPLGMTIGALPIVAAIEHDEHRAGLEAAAGLLGVAGLSATAGTRARPSARRILDREPGALAHGGVAAVAADREIGADLERRRPASWRARRRRGRPPRSGRSPPPACADGTSDSALPCSARKSRKSHCGISATNLQRVGRWLKSANAYCAISEERADA